MSLQNRAVGMCVASTLVAAGAVAQTDQVKFYGSPTAAISSGVVIPPGRAFVWTSGTTAAVKADAPAGSRERFGDTKTQAASILQTIAGQLQAQGLSMKDVVYLRAYLVPDPANGNRIDTAGWNAAYGEVFGTAANPTKPARSTVGAAAGECGLADRDRSVRGLSRKEVTVPHARIARSWSPSTACHAASTAP